MTVTERQRAARRLNGQAGGRPNDWTGEQAGAREQARRLGRKALPAAVRLWRRLVAGRVKGAAVADRIRAAENLCDRFGLPRLERSQVQDLTFPVKLYDLTPIPAPGEPVRNQGAELAAPTGPLQLGPVAPVTEPEAALAASRPIRVVCMGDGDDD